MFGGTSFSVDALKQDGSTVGQLTSVEIAETGVVSATYSNGTSLTLGMVAMATFPNQQGLTKIGDTCWRASLDSGQAVPSQPGVGTAGAIQSSALELSNVDLASMLVDLITAQRNYQANSRALDISNTVMDSILNIR
jgi:flagellar hook protein FlgE